MPQIKIYSTRTCPYCHMLKDYLKSKNIEFQEALIDTEPGEAEKAMDACGSMATPCTHITLDNGKEVKILGFDKAKFNEVLGIG